jgi:hypothetical protein
MFPFHDIDIEPVRVWNIGLGVEPFMSANAMEVGGNVVLSGALPDIQTNSDLASVLSDDALCPLWVLQRSGPKVHASSTQLQRCGQRCVITNTSGELNLGVSSLTNHFGDNRAVVSPAERSIQINQVNPLCSSVDPILGRSKRVTEVLLATRLTLG